MMAIFKFVINAARTIIVPLMNERTYERIRHFDEQNEEIFSKKKKNEC